MVEVDTELAEFMGAFEETALSAEDALEARFGPPEEDLV